MFGDEASYGPQLQTGTIAWPPPSSGRGGEVGNEQVALCEMAAAWTCSSLLIITHEGTLTNWLLPSSSRRSQRSDTGSPCRPISQPLVQPNRVPVADRHFQVDFVQVPA